MSNKKSKKNMKPVISGNQVTLPVHKAGNVLDNHDYIDQLIKDWLKDNPDKRKTSAFMPIEVAATRCRKVFIRSVSFTFEDIPKSEMPEPTIINVIKAYVKVADTYQVIILTDDYDKHYSKVKKLVSIAKQDFPNLTDDDITIQTFVGNTYKYHIAIEFNTKECVPENYILMSKLGISI